MPTLASLNEACCMTVWFTKCRSVAKYDGFCASTYILHLVCKIKHLSGSALHLYPHVYTHMYIIKSTCNDKVGFFCMSFGIGCK